jgi:DNA-binding LytR/AlgR family response regulator
VRLVIADDEPLARDLLRALLAHLPDVRLVGEATDGEELLALIPRAQPDAVILDIGMPRLDGLQAALRLDRATRPALLFVTADPAHAIDAFDLDAVDYVLKPVRLARLSDALDRLRRRVAAAPADEPDAGGCFWVPLRGRRVRVPVADILWVEAARDHAFLVTAQRRWMIRATMAELERRLEGSGLVRSHRSAFVRPSAIVAVRRDGRKHMAQLSNGDEAPVSDRYLDVLPTA